MAQDQATADKLISALGTLGYLDADLAAFRLQRAFCNTSSMMGLQTDFVRKEDLPFWNVLFKNVPLSDWFSEVSPDSPIFDGVNRAEDIQILGNSSMAYVMCKIDDPWGFKDRCNKVQSSPLFRLVYRTYHW